MPVLPRGIVPPLATVSGYGTSGQVLVSNGTAPPSFQSPVATVSATVDQVTTSSTMANVVGHSFAIGVSETWTVEFNLWVTGGTASTGTVFQITGPASPNNVRIFTFGDTTGVTLVSSDSQGAFGTPTQAYVAGTFSGYVRIMACIENGGNAGTIQLQYASNTNTQTNTIVRGSYMTARKV
jgi:hypothetical protein